MHWATVTHRVQKKAQQSQLILQGLPLVPDLKKTEITIYPLLPLTVIEKEQELFPLLQIKVLSIQSS